MTCKTFHVDLIPTPRKSELINFDFKHLCQLISQVIDINVVKQILLPYYLGDFFDFFSLNQNEQNFLEQIHCKTYIEKGLKHCFMFGLYHSFHDEPAYVNEKRGDYEWLKCGLYHRDSTKPALMWRDWQRFEYINFKFINTTGKIYEEYYHQGIRYFPKRSIL